MKVTVQFAEEHFGDLAEAADSGEMVEIARPGRPSLFLVPRAPIDDPDSARAHRVLGAGRGEMRPVSDEEWQSMKEAIERQMVHDPLMTAGEV